MAELHMPQLRVPQATSKFPLSSPISDEVSSWSFESRWTANSSTLTNSTRSSPTPFDDVESGNTSEQDEFPLEKYSERSTWTRAGRLQHRSEKASKVPRHGGDASLERKKKPGLNIVTDFSRTNEDVRVEDPLRNGVSVQQQPRPGKENSNPNAEAPTCMRKEALQNPGFVSLTDLENLRKNKGSMFRPKAWKGANKYPTHPVKMTRTEQLEREGNADYRGTFSDPPLEEVSRNKAFKSSQDDQDYLSHYLPAPEQPTNEFSPTARTVVIGITVPRNEVEAHKPSDELSSALTLQTPITPTIIVTPADATTGWSPLGTQQFMMDRQISNQDSQAIGAFYRQDAEAPPVPSLPDLHKQVTGIRLEDPHKGSNTWEPGSACLVRTLSSETLGDEDETNQAQKGPLSAGSGDGILPSSCSTGRPRSKGWWNLMLSPMLSRAGTNATKKVASPLEQAPSVSHLVSANENGLGLGEPSSASAMSPETPRRAGLDNIRNSTWSNWTQWEYAREGAQASQQSYGNREHTGHNTNPEPESSQQREAVIDASTKKKGHAAEYYQACAFDQLNPVPYFECVNHDCTNALPKLGAFHRVFTTSGDSHNSLQSGVGTLQPGGLDESPTLHAEARFRSDSDATVIEDDPVELSPNVRTADVRPILKAAAQPLQMDGLFKNELEEKDKSFTPPSLAAEASRPASRSATPPPYSSPSAKANIPRYVRIMPPDRQYTPFSPGPLSPEAQRAMQPSGGVPMSQIDAPACTSIPVKSTYPADLPPRPAAACISLSDIEDPAKARQRTEGRRRRLEQEDAVAHKAGSLWRGRGCFPEHGCLAREGPAGRARRRWYIGVATCLILIIILSVVLATQLTRRGDQTPVQSQWLNLTGYPPMPTGISTIAQPDMAKAARDCVQPSSLWSCALPREDQGSKPGEKPDQPDFRFEIRFRNGTVDANGTIPILSGIKKRARLSQPTVLAKRQHDPFTNSLFEPNPSPPSLSEQSFIGNTTDNNSFPFAGDTTPFFITILTTDPTMPKTFNDSDQHLRRRRRKRQNIFGSETVPAPAVLSDGTAAPANLLPRDPLPSSQPVMLYNRGLDTEHYGFYTYFDKSIFIKTTGQFNSSSSSTDNQMKDGPDNLDGGASKQDADVRCTWAQTRYLVQMWTSPRFGGQLLPSATGVESSPGPGNDGEGDPSNSGLSSATHFSRPGSFPYPVTVTLDRHGGDGSKKGVYCYGMDGQQKIVVSEKKLVAELRGAGGTLVNGAPGIFSNTAGNDGFDPKAGGIDGGTGGCACEWRNWAGSGAV